MTWLFGVLIVLVSIDVLDRIGPSRIGYAAAVVASRAADGRTKLAAFVKGAQR